MTTSIEAKSRLIASDWSRNLDEIQSAEIGSVVKAISKVVNIQYVRTEGYNEDGNAGCEVVFVGKTAGLVGYDPGVSPKDLSAVCKLMATPGVDSQLLADDQGNLVLVMVSESD